MNGRSLPRRVRLILVKAITVAFTTLHPVDNNTSCITIQHTNMYVKQSNPSTKLGTISFDMIITIEIFYTVQRCAI